MISQNIIVNIPVTNAKDFLNHVIDKITKDNKVKKFIYKKHVDEFIKNIDIVLKNFNITDYETVHFKLIDSKLYFNIVTNDIYEYYSSELLLNSEIIERIGHPLFSLLIYDLKSIIYKNGYKYIEDLLNKLLDVEDPKIPKEDKQGIVLSIGGKYAEQVDKLIYTLSQYGAMVDNIDGFVLEEWDKKRSLIDSKVLRSICENTENSNEFLHKYVETTIVLMAKGAFELEQIVGKIKYN